MKLHRCKLDGVLLWELDAHSDSRGRFVENFRHEWLQETHPGVAFCQDNLVHSKQRVLRGMHFTRQPGQHKLISVALGRIFDVVVDLRAASASFGQFESIELDDSTPTALFVPAGFAHGYAVLSETAVVSYKVSSYYAPSEELGFSYADKSLGIGWPFADPILSARDRSLPSFAAALQTQATP